MSFLMDRAQVPRLLSPQEHFVGRSSGRVARLLCLFCLDFTCSLAPLTNLSFLCFLSPSCVCLCVCVSFRLSPVAAIPPLFWRLPQGVAVTVDHAEQHGPRGAAQTVEFSRGAPIQAGLEIRVGAHLLAGGLVRRAPAATPAHRRSSSERLA